MKLIDDMSENGKIPVILTGDFNMTPNSCPYNNLLKSKCNNKFNFEEELTGRKPVNPIIKVPTKFSNQEMTSVYNNILKREPKITIVTEHFKNCLDYIFINNKFSIIAILNELPDSYLKKIKYLPNKNHPSDHIPLKAIIDYK